MSSASSCVLMFADPSGIHRLHRRLWGVHGTLPKAGG